MASNLKGRLARIKSLGLVRAADLDETDEPSEFASGPRAEGGPSKKTRGRANSPESRRGRGPRPDFLKAWEKRGDFLWFRTLRYDFAFPRGIDPEAFAPLGRRSARRKDRAEAKATTDAGGRISPERLRFFDLETTGLSGGTGTIAFLAAVGRCVEEGFEIAQLFIDDFPGEGAFVESLVGMLREGVVVSYNGKSFDMPLLRTRCVMNAVALPQLPHIDALFTSRRLWKRVYGGAALGLLEREVLGVEREEDLPGSMIPDAWLDFARTGESRIMGLALSHNAVDVLSLARLVARAQAVFDEPRSSLARSDLDRAGLGRILIAAGRAGEGEELLEAAAGEGDGRAALMLMRRYRLAGRLEDCARALSLLPEGYAAAIERAKFHERLSGDLAAAEAAARAVLELAQDKEEREAGERRLLRIGLKIARKEGRA